MIAPFAPRRLLWPLLFTATITGFAADEDEPITLSPFAVSARQDVGYQAGNTTSGSRFNTSLQDTAAAVMVFTPEFLADFGANALADIVGYAPNMQVDMLDTSADASPQFLGGADLKDTRIRVRGLSASTALDFFETNIAIDNYNTERFELSSGPNSILFGFGAPGGLVNILTKRAQLDRTRTTLRTQVGEWSSRRGEVDHNAVLVPGRLALRLNGLQQASAGWRTWDENDTRRLAASLRARPWPATTATVNYEVGRMDAHVSRPLNAYDNLALWQASGAPVKSDATWTAADRASGLNRSTTARALYVTTAEGAPPFTLTLANAANTRILESTYENNNLPTADRAGATLAPAALVPFRVDTYGPGAVRAARFHRVFTLVEQRLAPGLTAELAWNHERARQHVDAPQLANIVLGGDPNSVIPNPTGAGGTVPNPNVGRLFLEARWTGDVGATKNDIARATLAWEVKLGRWGTHRLAGLAEHGYLRAFRYPQVEILVDEGGVPISNAALPENAANFVYRRHYFTPGAFRTYYGGDVRDPVALTRSGHTYRSVSINGSASGGDIARTMNTLMLATQSTFWEGRVVVTAGVRRDRLRFDQYGDARLAADAPDVLAGRAIANTIVFTPAIADVTRFAPVTSTVGGVWHASRWLSFFANHATNNAPPPLNFRVLPDETLPPPFDGRSDDAGLMLQLWEGRVFVRATAFRTAQEKSSGGTFLISLTSAENNIVGPSTRILDTLLAAGRITAADYTAHRVGDESTLTGMSDVVNEGLELSAWCNVTRDLTAVVNASHTRTDRSRVVPEFDPWFERENAFWHGTPGAGALVNPATGVTIDAEVQELQRIVAGVRDYYRFDYGERPWKFNASGRYRFSSGWAKGGYGGAGVRWQDRSKLGRRIQGRTTDGTRVLGDAIYGPEDFKVDAFLGYRRRLSSWPFAPELTVQLNVSNLTNEEAVLPLRYNALYSGYARVLLLEPRRFRLSVGLAF